MQAKRAFIAIALYAGWPLAGLLAALALTVLLARVYDPHGDGAPGNGILYIAVFFFLSPVGLALGFFRASALWRKRNTKAQ